MNHTTSHRAGRYSARIVASAAVAVLAVTGCSSDAKTSSSTAAPTAATTAGSPAAAGGATLTIKDFAFSTVTGAKAGEAISVTNADSAKHTVTADDGSFKVSVDGGGTATITVDKAGTYAFHCEIHKAMHGSITVG